MSNDQPGAQQCPTCKTTVLASSDNPEGYCGAHRPKVPPSDKALSLDEMVRRIGRALGEHLGPRFNVGGNGAMIEVADRWAPGPPVVFTIEHPRYWTEGTKLYCQHGVILHGGSCVQCERGE